MSKFLETKFLIIFWICCSLLLQKVLTQQAKDESPMQCNGEDKDVNKQCSLSNNGNDHGVKNDDENKYTTFKGHLMPFGESGSKTNIQTVMGFPKTNFFLDYVIPSIPVLMKGAATLSPSFHKWTTDEYLFRLASLPNNRFKQVEVEKGKKETRSGDMADMTFYDFLKVYNTSDIYMVSDVSPFMEPILMMPCPLQCPELNQVPFKRVVWFSSGGTKSVVHTDSIENINCLYRGKKTVVMLDPSTISTGSIIDKMSGSYSSLDVESVDLNKFPTLRGASFVIATMEPGDCLYIPYHWIHQVTSFGSNLAVNVWFNTQETHDVIRKGHCTDRHSVCDPTYTLGRVQHPDMMEDQDKLLEYGVHLIRSFFELSSLRGETSLNPEDPPLQKYDEKVKMKEFVRGLIKEDIVPLPEKVYKSGVLEKVHKEISNLLEMLDANGDGVLTSMELEQEIETVWKAIKAVFAVDGEDNDKGMTENHVYDYDDDDDENMNDKSTYSVDG